MLPPVAGGQPARRFRELFALDMSLALLLAAQQELSARPPQELKCVDVQRCRAAVTKATIAEIVIERLELTFEVELQHSRKLDHHSLIGSGQIAEPPGIPPTKPLVLPVHRTLRRREGRTQLHQFIGQQVQQYLPCRYCLGLQDGFVGFPPEHA